MLSKIIELNRIDAANIFPHLYDIFRRDFVESRAMLGGALHVDPQSHRKSDGCEETFWHLTTRCDSRFNGSAGNQPVERLPDLHRGARLEWVRQIIERPTDECVCMFYYQENNRKRDIRLYLWAWDYDFVVILQRLGKSKTYLVTSFYLDHEAKVQTYYARNEAYHARTNPALHGCEWF
jgi:hypothetical protein